MVVEAVRVEVETPVCTLAGTVHASPGDWIITGVAGERYPITPDILALTYDSVPDDTPLGLGAPLSGDVGGEHGPPSRPRGPEARGLATPPTSGPMTGRIICPACGCLTKPCQHKEMEPQMVCESCGHREGIPTPRYHRGLADGSTCGTCHQTVTWLGLYTGTFGPAFFICWTCKTIGQVGVGPVVEQEDTITATRTYCRGGGCCCVLPVGHTGDCSNQRGHGLTARYVHEGGPSCVRGGPSVGPAFGGA